MKKIWDLVCLILLLAIGACQNTDKKGEVLIDNFALQVVSHPNWEELFSSRFNIVPLETREECLLGDIEKTRKHKDGYYLLSSQSSILYHFDQQGKFCSKIAHQGGGPEEYHRIEDFDICEVDRTTEVWISDNISLKIYDAENGTFKRKIAFPFIIHKFKRMPNGHILLVTGQNDQILTVTDEHGKVLYEYLKKEIPYLMFRSVQFIKKGEQYLFQLGVSNDYVSFNSQKETFGSGQFINDNHFLTKDQLLTLFRSKGNDYLFDLKDTNYLNHLVILDDRIWMHTHQDGKEYLTKIENGQCISVEFSYGTPYAYIMGGESDDSILFPITADQLLANKDLLPAHRLPNIKEDDNPCIVEFF